MYTTNESGSWISIKLDSNNNVGKYCSIAIDSADGLHVSYRHETGNKLKYAYKAMVQPHGQRKMSIAQEGYTLQLP